MRVKTAAAVIGTLGCMTFFAFLGTTVFERIILACAGLFIPLFTLLTVFLWWSVNARWRLMSESSAQKETNDQMTVLSDLIKRVQEDQKKLTAEIHRYAVDHQHETNLLQKDISGFVARYKLALDGIQGSYAQQAVEDLTQIDHECATFISNRNPHADDLFSESAQVAVLFYHGGGAPIREEEADQFATICEERLRKLSEIMNLISNH